MLLAGNSWKFVLILGVLWQFYSTRSESADSCQVNSSTSLVSPCSNCSAEKNYTQHIKGYEELDVTSTICGCLGNGVVTHDDSQNVTKYDETHVIYAKNKSIKNIFLIVKDASSSSIRQTYTFVLLSIKPMEWIVSSNRNLHFKFFISHKSSVKLHESGQKVPAIAAGFATTTGLGSPYHAAQIKPKVCEITLQKSDRNCPLASFLEVRAVKYLDLVVGNMNDSLSAERTCNVHPLQKIQHQSKVKGLLLSSKTPIQACSGRKSAPNQYVFLVDVFNHTRNSTIGLELNGLSSLMNGEVASIILHSNVPVLWKPYDANEQDLSITVTFVVSNGSSVDTSALSISDNSGSVSVKTFSGMLAADETLLDTARKIYNISTASYAKFINQPSVIKVLFFNYDVVETWGPPETIPENIIILLQMQMLITSSGSQLRIFNSVMQRYGFEMSDVKLGDGSCSSHEHDNYVLIEDLAKCGLYRIDYDAFHIKIAIKKRNGVLRYVIPRREPKLKISELITETEISYPQRLDEHTESYIVQVFGTEHAEHGVYSQLKQCYLNNISNLSDVVPLIDHSRSVSSFVRYLTPHYDDNPSARYKTFLLTLDPHQFLRAKQIFNLTCVLSRCFTRKNNAALSDLLPECFNQQETVSSNLVNSDYTAVASVNSFVYDPQLTTEAATSQTQPFTDLYERTASSETKQFSVGVKVLTYITAFFVGFVLGTLFLYVLCVSFRNKWRPLRPQKKPASAKIDVNGRNGGIQVELIEYCDPDDEQRRFLNLSSRNDDADILIRSHWIPRPNNYSSQSSTPNSDSLATDQTSLIQSSSTSTDCGNGENLKIKSPVSIIQTTTE